MRSVHDLHLWSLTADLPAASVHLAVNPEADKEQVTIHFILKILKLKKNFCVNSVYGESGSS